MRRNLFVLGNRFKGLLNTAGSNNKVAWNRHGLVPAPSRTFATKVSALSLTAKKRKGKKISMVTAYDYPSAVHVSRAGIDIVLVGDSVAMVELGHETTQRLSMDHIIHHCISVKTGLEFVKSGSMLVGDMPFGSYEFEDTDVALRNAYRFVKEGGCDAVKLEVSSSLRTVDLVLVLFGLWKR
jgi:3-methyl-2-oxobutanoate hydroxymethyltransferase